MAAYVHGSSVLGGFVPGRSDVDLLLVVDTQPLSRSTAKTLGEVMLEVGECPGSGLEVSAVAAVDASSPASPWPFVVHASSTPGDRKVLVGDEHDGDPDLALHYAVVRQSGWVVYGPPPEEVVGVISPEVVRDSLRSELLWGLEHAPMAYAVLNAARALRYAADEILCSKLDGGKWAINHGEPAEIIAPALDDQRLGTTTPITAAQAAWVRRVVALL